MAAQTPEPSEQEGVVEITARPGRFTRATSLFFATPVISGLAVGSIVLLAGVQLVWSVVSGCLAAGAALAVLLWFRNWTYGNRIRELETRLTSDEESLRELKEKASRLDEIESARSRLQFEVSSLTGKLEAAGARIVDLEKEKGTLLSAVETQRAEMASVKGQAEQLGNQLRQADARAASAQAEIGRVTELLRQEQLTTARAPYIPLIRAHLNLAGFGLLRSKTVHVILENIGPGRASNVELAVAPEQHGAVGPLTPKDFVSALGVGERRDVAVGTLDDFGNPVGLHVVVTYESQFGTRAPLRVRFGL